MNDDYKIHVGIRWVLYTDRYGFTEDRGCSQRQVSGRHIQDRCTICQEGRMLVREGLRMDWLDRLFKQAEEQERKRDKELKKIANGILAKLPKCDFEPCAVCGNKPELEVTVYGDNTYRLDV